MFFARKETSFPFRYTDMHYAAVTYDVKKCTYCIFSYDPEMRRNAQMV